MTAPWVGRRMPRVEDERLLRGLGRYVDDLTTADAVHATVVRSPVAHGVLTDFRVAEVPAGSRVLGPDELAAFNDDVDQLHEDAERLAARIARVQQATEPGAPR